MGPAASALLVLASAAGGPLDWLAGTWCTEDGASRTCEHWEPMAGGTMLGASQTVRDGRTTGFEFMRIVLEGDRAVFHASPNGAPTSAFSQAERSDQKVVFANAAHDYPQRIVYWREGDVLLAEISLADGSKPSKWRYAAKTED